MSTSQNQAVLFNEMCKSFKWKGKDIILDRQSVATVLKYQSLIAGNAKSWKPFNIKFKSQTVKFKSENLFKDFVVHLLRHMLDYDEYVNVESD